MYLHCDSKDTKCLNTMCLVVPSVPAGQHHRGTVTHVTPCLSPAADTAQYRHLLARAVQRIPAPSDFSCDIPVRLCVSELC